MDISERELRQIALNEACRHKLSNERAEDIVKNAEKYYTFLLGDKQARPEWLGRQVTT